MKMQVKIRKWKIMSRESGVGSRESTAKTFNREDAKTHFWAVDWRLVFGC